MSSRLTSPSVDFAALPCTGWWEAEPKPDGDRQEHAERAAELAKLPGAEGLKATTDTEIPVIDGGVRAWLTDRSMPSGPPSLSTCLGRKV